MMARPLFRGYGTVTKARIQKSSQRPLRPFSQILGGFGDTPLRRDDPVPLSVLYQIAFECNAVATCIKLLKQYVFKEGFEFVPKWSRKCLTCEMEHPADSKPDMCECGAFSQYDAYGREVKWYREPDKKKAQALEKYLKEVNDNGFSFKHVCQLFEQDLNIANDAFMVISREYKKVDAVTGQIVEAEVKEINIGSPEVMRLDINPATGRPGTSKWICLVHRPKVNEYAKYQFDYSGSGGFYREPGYCRECQLPLHPVWYVVVEKPGSDKPVQYYVRDEVVWTQMDPVGYGYGSLGSLAGIANEAMFLIYQIRYSTGFYVNERSPRGFVAAYTNNAEGLINVMDQVQNQAVSRSPTYPPVIAVQPTEGVTNPFEYIELSKPPADLEYTEQRDETTRRLGARFGIMPAYLGNTDSTGLSNQGPNQRAITTLAAEMRQAIYNENVFPKLMRLWGQDARFLGVDNEFELHLRLPEEKNDIEKYDVEIRKAQHAVIMQNQLGFRIKGRDDEGNFEFEEMPSQPGMMGGFGQGPPPGGGGFGAGGVSQGAPSPPPLGGPKEGGEGSEQRGV